MLIYLEIICPKCWIYYWTYVGHLLDKKTLLCITKISTSQLVNYREIHGGPVAINCHCPMVADSHTQKVGNSHHFE